MDFVVKKPINTNRTIRMPETLIETLCELASKKGISFNKLVIQCCEFALENLKNSDSTEAEK